MIVHTLTGKLGTLAPEAWVLPAHYSGASEIGPDGIVATKLGDLRVRLPEFQVASEQNFVDSIVRTTPNAAGECYAGIMRTNLGAEEPDASHVTEWELGKNDCAAGY
jgi:hypothetical protein